MTTKNQLLFPTLLVSALLPLAALAQNDSNPAYLVDGSGAIVTSSVSGLCWHTGEWTPALAVAPCDPVITRVADATPAPAQEAATPVTPLAPVVAAMPQKISFSSDALFGFDKATLRPEGKEMLDGLTNQLKGAEYNRILVTGHADRIGRATYNQKLSEERANSVKSYLVTKDIPQDRIDASGLGETQPVTKPGECVGTQKTAKLIACLQPDRRVDVEVSGTIRP